ncbi:hypothetical protein [Kribbella ginsengisoli]|uniref:Uncharacterized protein n=1 Tax=Kribbella ginsengisoli TaxID=363865 RepID=A0ABP6XDT3_9ACTN
MTGYWLRARRSGGVASDQTPLAERDWQQPRHEIADPVERIRFASATGLIISNSRTTAPGRRGRTGR